MLVVLDTNILVSALWSKSGNTHVILDMLLTKELTPCYDSRILYEYESVLKRPKFNFSPSEVSALIHFIKDVGISVVPEHSNDFFEDEDDRKFFDVAVFCNAPLITGNTKHYPSHHLITTAKEFLLKIKS